MNDLSHRFFPLLFILVAFVLDLTYCVLVTSD